MTNDENAQNNQERIGREQRMPVLFIGHGSPMNAIQSNQYHRSWSQLAQNIPTPKAVLCISAHWETSGVFVTASEHPATIHDFYGFPQDLFDVQYSAPGDPGLANLCKELLSNYDAQLDPSRGFDHGAWSVLLAMYPNADVPVIQLSLDRNLSGITHYEMAKELTPLRENGVLILGSGNIVHNLSLFRADNAAPLSWALQFNDDIVRRIASRDHQALADYNALGAEAALAIPTPEHYLPLLYALAVQSEEETMRIFNDDVLSSLAMTSTLTVNEG